MIVTELVVGLSAGLIITIWFSAAVLAGEKIATSAGLGFAAQIDPSTGAQTPVVSKNVIFIFDCYIFGMNGHLVVIRTMLDSYSYLPIGEMPAFGALIEGWHCCCRIDVSGCHDYHDADCHHNVAN